MDLVMSHVNQKEPLEITTQEVAVLPNNVPIVDDYLNNYRSHKANVSRGGNMTGLPETQLDSTNRRSKSANPPLFTSNQLVTAIGALKLH